MADSQSSLLLLARAGGDNPNTDAGLSEGTHYMHTPLGEHRRKIRNQRGDSADITVRHFVYVMRGRPQPHRTNYFDEE